MPRRVFAAILVLGAASCGSPSEPTPAIPDATVTRFEVIGPPTASPTAGLVKYRAVATFSDGSTSDVTDVAGWRLLPLPTSPQPLRPLRAGEFQVAGNGEVNVSATFRLLSASQNLLVLPPGTFKLRGRVTTTDGRPLPYTSVTVVDGIGSGSARSSATSTRDFNLYGVFRRLQPAQRQS